ncbi:MAG: NADP-dependent oxidoreductase, partial [Alphaproteobacteria bacterium]|nr:NADP-dependent oxidoreductase [Alphaproteobacteria bacterium]
RMSDAKSYADPQPLGEVMMGGTVGEVIESNSARFAVGDKVLAMGGWQLYATQNEKLLQKVDDTHIPLSAFLGPVGMPGVTAWYGLNMICAPKEGETVVVSSASGAVGSVVGQLAKAKGCFVVGIAGGADKCAHVVNDLGFDACIDYKAGNLRDSFKTALGTKRIDAYFDNVGGEILETVLGRMNAFGRLALCGMIAGYDGEPIPIKNPIALLVNRVRLQGFIVTDHMEHWPKAMAELGEVVASGTLKYHETIAQGLASAPEAFVGLLKGKNLGKQLVKLS